MKTITNRILSLAAILSLGISYVSAQKVDCIGGEYFWGISSSYGRIMPIGSNISHNYSVSDSIRWNLSSPVMVSNKGRYLVAGTPISVFSNPSEITFDGGVQLSTAGKTLRQSYLIAISKLFKPDGKVPDMMVFNSPSYNTWVGMGTSLSQSQVEEYANSILASSLKPGIIVIDNGWQNHSGSFEFNIQRFNDPKALVSFLHLKGFKVMLQVSPLVSLDCLEFIDFRNSGMLEKNADGSVKIVEWYGGMSAVLDLSNEESISYVRNKLEALVSEYAVDGFKFDYMGACRFSSQQEYLSRLKPWTELAMKYPLSQIHESYKSQNYSSIVGLLEYNGHNWEAMKSTISEALNAGLCGYPFVVPDVVGGGFAEKIQDVDNNLIVRQAQLQAFLPSMQFSMPVWKVLPADMAEMVKSAQNLHGTLLPYITELVQSAATTGEPIIRSMEYVFPNKGFYDCTDQFMLGNRYLVAPITSSDNSRTVRLPAGTWIDDQGKKFKGPAVIKVNVPLSRNLYFKASKDIKTK